MRPKKILAALALAGLLATASCAGHGSKDASSSTLSLVADKGFDYNKFSGVSQKDIGISLQTSTYGDEDAFVAFVKQSLRTPKAPDMFTWHVGDQLQQLVDQGLVAETSDQWKSAIASNWISPSVEKLYTVNGKQYCTPNSVDDWVMFYNKHVFEKYGIEPPTTWAEMMSAAATLHSHGVAPFWMQGGDPWAFVWFQLILAGMDMNAYEGLSTGKVSYTDPRVKAAMAVWSDMLKKGYFSDPGSKTGPETQLKDGTVAMIPFGTSFPDSLTQAGMKAGSDWGAFPIPAMNLVDGKTPMAVETAPLCVAEHSTKKAAGLKYSKWWMSPQAQTPWSAELGNLPFNPKAKASTPTYVDLSKKISNTSKYTTYLRYYEATPTPILTTALDEFTGFMLHPDDINKPLQDIQNTAQTYWSGKR